MSSLSVHHATSLTLEYEKVLNPEQLGPVQAPDGPLFVLAAAGTGKTRTLVYRVAWLVEHGVDPRRILLLTFTNKAAREMLERANELVGGRVGGLWGGTFHHMANRMLRRHGQALGYGLDYTILDTDDTRTLVRSCLDTLKLKGKEFPKPDVLLAVLSGAVNSRKSLKELCEARFERHPVDPADILRVLKLFEKRKRDQNAMDFDDLLVNGLRLFQEHPLVLAEYQEHFLYVMVDEYQDTNPIQADWVDLVSARHRNLLVVGDDFQSIYSWRGADYRNIISFPERYPDARLYKLETNYRSVPEILDVANSCIAGNPNQFQKILRAVRPAYRKPHAVQLDDGEHQARYVTDQIRRLHQEGRAWRDMAVLYRAHYHAMELQMALSRERIPYAVTSGVRFFEQAHVKDVCSLPRLLHNPGDELAFMRLVGLLPGVGEKTASRLWALLSARFDPRDLAARKLLEQRLPAAARSSWAAVETVLADAAGGEAEGHPADLLIRFMDAFYDQYALDTFEDYERRMDDLKEMATFAGRFPTAQDFLNEIALISNLDADAERLNGPEEDAVRLSTIHQSKGLEWASVFVLWAVDGLFPSGRSMEEPGGEEEERRLFYVAVTRAKDELYLCAPQSRRSPDGNRQFYSLSRFVREIPPDRLQADNQRYH